MSRISASIILSLLFVLGFAQTKDKNIIRHGDIQLFISTPYIQTLSSFKPRTAIISAKDTIWEKNSDHIFKDMPFGKYLIYVEAEGFIPVQDSIEVDSEEINAKLIMIEDRVIDLQMVVVEGTRPAMVFKGDTLIFTPDGMNFTDQDKAREVLRRMPGVEIKEDGIRIGGQLISKTYVDGRTSLFGNNPLTAIDHIEASDVAHIYVYDEPEHPEETRKSRQGLMQRVINIVTKSKMINSVDATALIGAGPTIGDNQGSHDLRYVAGGDYNFFSDDWMLTANLLANNQNGTNTTPGYYLRTTPPSQAYNSGEKAELSIERKWEKVRGLQTTLFGKYSASHFSSEQTTASETNYLPTSFFAQRQYAAQNTTNKRYTENNALINFNRNHKRYRIQANYDLDILHSRDLTSSDSEDRIDYSFTKSGSRRESYQQTRQHKADIAWSLPLNRVRLELNGSYNNDTNEEEIERETYYNTDRLDLIIPSSDDNGLLSLSAALRFDTIFYSTDEKGRPIINKALYNTLSYNFVSDRREIARIAENASTHETDRTNTYSFSNHNTAHSLGLEGNMHLMQQDKLIGYKIAATHTNVSDRQTDISSAPFSRNFITPSISFIFRETSIKGGWNVIYLADGLVPSIAQMRMVTNDDNPLFIHKGNSELKAGTNHMLQATYNKLYGGIRGTSLSLSLITEQSSRFIANSTTISEEGITTNSYANLSGRARYTAEILYDLQLSKIKSRMRLQIEESIYRTPYIYNDIKYSQHRNTLNSYINYSTDRLRNTHIDIGLRSIYNVAKNGGQGDRSCLLDNQLRVTARTNNLGRSKRLFAEILYIFYNENYLSSDEVDNQHVLNIYAGAKIPHGLELSLTAYDIFNAYSGIKWTLTDNYTRKDFGQNYGRYLSLNLKWSLVKVKSNRVVRKPLIY